MICLARREQIPYERGVVVLLGNEHRLVLDGMPLVLHWARVYGDPLFLVTIGLFGVDWWSTAVENIHAGHGLLLEQGPFNSVALSPTMLQPMRVEWDRLVEAGEISASPMPPPRPPRPPRPPGRPRRR